MLSEEILAYLLPGLQEPLGHSCMTSGSSARTEACRRKYPIVDDIPNLLVEEGGKYADVAIEDLPTPSGG